MQTIPPPMGRRRTHDFDLPPRMVRRRSARGDRFYYVTHDRKWIPLGRDLPAARRLWADYESIGTAGTVDALVERYLSDCMSGAAPGTRKQYRSAARRIAEQWGSWRVGVLKPPHIARYRDTAPPGTANLVLALLRVAYAKAVEWGWTDSNPAAHVARVTTRARGRYLTDGELAAIRERAPDWLRVAIDLCYLTALRPGDVVALQWADVTGGRMFVRCQKTRARIAFDVTPALAAVLDDARRRPVCGLYVVATAKGRRITAARLGDAWRAARDAAGVSDAQVRDIRAKAATDAEAAGMDYQALLGHATRAMSDRYVRAIRTIRAQPLRALK